MNDSMQNKIIGGENMDNLDFTIANLDASKLEQIKKLESELSAEFGKDIYLIAWEKQK